MKRKKWKQDSHLNLKLFCYKNSKATRSDCLGGIEKHKLQNRKSILGLAGSQKAMGWWKFRSI